MNFFHHKDLGNHLLQLCPKVVKHPVYPTPLLPPVPSRQVTGRTSTLPSLLHTPPHEKPTSGLAVDTKSQNDT